MENNIVPWNSLGSRFWLQLWPGYMNMICGLLKANCIPTLAKLWESTQQNQEDAEEWKDDHAKIVLKCGRTTDTQELLYFSSTAFLGKTPHIEGVPKKIETWFHRLFWWRLNVQWLPVAKKCLVGSVYLVYLSWSKPIERGGVSQTQEALGEDGTLRNPSGGCDDLKREKKPGGATRKGSQRSHQGFAGGVWL